MLPRASLPHLLALIAIALSTLTGSAARAQDPAKLLVIRNGCALSPSCAGRHAIVFVHGIYGSRDTFTNTSVSPHFVWPNEIPDTIAGSPIDVYVLEYHTKLLEWARKKDVPGLDDVVAAVYDDLASLRGREYTSVDFIAHSLGGNVAKAYVHTVKSRDGHLERAKHGFIITLGTPLSGAAIANAALLFKTFVHSPDPLLESLTRDNTFLTMAAMWERDEDVKSTRFACRKMNLYAAIETKPMGPVQVVDTLSAMRALPGFAVKRTFSLNHSEIAKPRSRNDSLYVWVQKAMTTEIKRLNEWRGPLCSQAF
jgi:hypothetical protein